VEQTLLHELSHQWFGDAVTPAQWRGLWLNEGFATWVQFRWESEHGEAAANWRDQALRADGDVRNRYGPPGSPDPSKFAESNVYLCPALLLDTIRDRVGEPAFFALLTDWVRQHRDGTVDRAEFTAFANRHTGKDLTGLVDAWLDATTTPPAALGGR
jgi:aminopeptidase N